MTPPTIRQIPLNAREYELLTRSTAARRPGGAQLLLRALIARINHTTRVLSLLPQHHARARVYAVYCEGGYEDRFKALLAAVQRDDLLRVE